MSATGADPNRVPMRFAWWRPVRTLGPRSTIWLTGFIWIAVWLGLGYSMPVSLAASGLVFYLVYVSKLAHFTEQVERLRDVPSLEPQIAATAVISYEGRVVGQDEGLLWVINGVLYFDGLRTSFNLRSQDLRDAAVRAKRCYVLGHLPSGERFGVDFVLSNPKRDLGAVNRMFDTFNRSWEKVIEYSTYPPLEPLGGPNGVPDVRFFLLVWLSAALEAGLLGLIGKVFAYHIPGFAPMLETLAVGTAAAYLAGLWIVRTERMRRFNRAEQVAKRVRGRVALAESRASGESRLEALVAQAFRENNRIS